MTCAGRVFALSIGLALATGCAPRGGVVRVVDDRPIAGAFVPSEAYAAFLRGAIAEAGGDIAGAIEGYSIAVTLGPRDPEPWVRLGAARCARDPRDPKADEALDRALAIDDGYSPAWEARARCAQKRGDAALALRAAKRAVADDPRSVSSLAELADADPAATASTRARLVAMTMEATSDAAAWRALAAWGRSHADAILEARALSRVASLDPAAGADIDLAVTRLAGEGEIGEARALARARVATATRRPIDPLVARLAIDDALFAGDVAVARRLATRAHVSLPVVAARALLVGDAASARAIAEEVVAANPRAEGARLVLVAAGDALGDARVIARALVAGGAREDVPVPAEAWLVYARVVAREGSIGAARAVLLAFPREAAVAGDPLVTPIAVSLAAEGALDPSDLDANGRIELAERQAQKTPDDVVALADARHRLLTLARRAPLDARTLALAQRLAPVRARDSIVAVAFARLALAGAPGAPTMSAVLARLDPTDPLVAAVTRDFSVARPN